MVTSCGISVSSQVGFYGLFGDAGSARELNFGDVEAVETGDVGLIGGRNRFLRLHDFDVVGDSGCETILRFAESLASELPIALSHAHQFGSGGEVQKSGA